MKPTGLPARLQSLSAVQVGMQRAGPAGMPVVASVVPSVVLVVGAPLVVGVSLPVEPVPVDVTLVAEADSVRSTQRSLSALAALAGVGARGGEGGQRGQGEDVR